MTDPALQSDSPSPWDSARLKHLSRLIMGQSPPSAECNTREKGLPFLQGNAEFGRCHPQARLFCETPLKYAKAGDLLLSVRAPVGALNVADQEYGIGRGLCAIRADESMSSTFLAYYLETAGHNHLSREATGSTYEAVSTRDVGNLLIPVPPLPIQRAIAAFLDRETAKIDALIEKKRRLLDLLDEKRTALITRVVTCGLDPDVPMKDSGVEWLGEIPVHWEVTPVYARYDVALGKMLDSKTISGEHLAPYLRNQDVQWRTINVADLPEMDFSHQDRKRYGLRPGDLLVCEGGQIGRAAIWEGQLKECFYQKALHRVRARHSASEGYLLYVLWAAAHLGVFEASANPNTITHLTAVMLRHQRIPQPPSDEQRHIADYLHEAWEQTEQLKGSIHRAISLLQEYRTALISAAVTGQIDVSEAAA